MCAFVSFVCLTAAMAASPALAGDGQSSVAPLPKLDIVGPITVSGISSGADVAPMFHVAFSDRVKGSGAFAGQAFGCAVMAFDLDNQTTCGEQPSNAQGPGCVGLPATGGHGSPCVGCRPGVTVAYDHCKKENAGELIQLSRLRAWAEAAAAAGSIASLAHLRDARVFTYRGTKDTVYLPGSVNATGEFFWPYLADARRQAVFEASVPSQHCQPSVDPNVPADSCGNYTVGGVQNCGYDGAGHMLQTFYDGALTPPPPGGSTDPSRLFNFSQDLYGNASAQFAGMATTGFIYVPARCAAGPCRLHMAMHGCGQSYTSAGQGLKYVLFGGYGPWADANGLVILFPQGGGFAERGWTGAAPQIMAGCQDGYGQTSVGYATREGLYLSTLAKFVAAVAGEDWGLRRAAQS